MNDIPPGVLADGTVKVAVLDAFTGAVTATEAAAAVDISCYFTSDGFNRGLNEQTVTDDRLCTTQSGEEPGRYNETLDVIYVWDQQNTVPDENVAYNELKPGTTKYLLVRYGKPFDEPFAADDVVDVIKVKPGRQGRNTPAANEKLKIGQKLFIPAGGVTTDLVIDAAA